ncbi:hypothetical protein QBC42DRAFT_260854 [Cladorrhinum samala]|uniref:RRM domain-containing protein n=1 Tax=Cladorrhinum samala TaxID=585594 RepID=A0AAV9I3X6_9PEZI|nr:hypothetical protein QBC42DRAFT_260854 [Cladorrhinum samala]
MAANGSNQKVASDFEKIINEARGRKKNEALAARIFNKDRRSSTPASSSNTKLSGAGSLASRAGVKKSRLRQSTGNINGEWTHDLHSPSQNSQPPKGPKALALGSLAARITDPSSPIPTGPRSTKKNRAAQVAQALIRTELQQQPKPLHRHQQQQHRAPHNAPTGPSSSNAFKAAVSSGIQIRGLAGPYIVMAQNFAPGTTAADIESAMTRVGGIITSCRVVKHHPLVIAEIVFESREGADEVVKAFDGQTADGRILSVYHKPGNTPTNLVPPAPAAPSNPSSSRGASEVVDGSYGFDEPMMDIGSNSNNSNNNNNNNNSQRGGAGGRGGGFSNGNNGGNGKAPPTGPSGGLYSDGMIRRGRGFNNGYGRGRGGGGR